jgi:hypothetical protein
MYSFEKGQVRIRCALQAYEVHVDLPADYGEMGSPDSGRMTGNPSIIR